MAEKRQIDDWEISTTRLSEQLHAIAKIIERLEKRVEILDSDNRILSNNYLEFKGKVLAIWATMGLLISGLIYGWQQLNKIPVLESKIITLESKK